MPNLTLLDQARRVDPDGKTARIVEMLNLRNDVLDDMPWIEANGTDGHQTTVRTGLPTPTWRMFNQGVATTKSETAQITEGIGMMEMRSEIDVDLANRGGDPSGMRLSEAAPHFEAMYQEFVSTLLYGNTGTAPNEFHGLAPRFNSLSAANAQNILDAGGTSTDNTSIWLVVWGEQTVHGIYPKGSMAGLSHKDLGEGDAFDASSRRFRALMDQWKWHCGVAVRDWRYIVRIANIDISNLTSESSAADLIKLMIKATKRVPSLSMGRAAFYMNRNVEQMLDIQRFNVVAAGGGTNHQNVDGMARMNFRGIPIGILDGLLENESRVT